MIPIFKPLTNPLWTRKVMRQLNSGYVGPGLVTMEFERRFSEYVGLQFCSTTTSGTMALWLALRALALPRESTVLFPAYGMAAGANAAAMLGLDVRLVDIDEEMLCIHPTSESMENATAMIGIAANGEWNGCENLALESDVPCIIDACQAIGCPHKWGGDIACYSFSPQKPITTGQGGAVLTNNNFYSGRIRAFRTTAAAGANPAFTRTSA